MKQGIIFPQVDKVSVPSENEVQRQLRGILEYWGPDGERHLVSESSLVPRKGDRRCVYDAYHHLNRGDEISWHCGPRAAIQAAREQLFPEMDYHQVSASSFHNARKMVLRAIELAGHPTVKS